MNRPVIPNAREERRAPRHLRVPLTGPKVAEIPRLWLGMTVAVALGLLSCTSPRPVQAPAASEVGVRPGQRAPDFQVTSLDGQPLNNTQVSGGKPYILYYFASW